MAQQIPSCPPNSFHFNSTLCACNPGYLMDPSGKNCALFRLLAADRFVVNSGVDYSIKFPEFFPFDSIKRFTQSQAVFLESTLIVLLTWLTFCLIARFGKLDDGRSPWFQIRWWISRLDFCYATRHWLDDQKVVMKRKTELGGTLSIASAILFIGLFAALLYNTIAKRSVEVHNLKPANAPELLSFVNDMEFNITTISSMSCSNLRRLGSLVSGAPGSAFHRVSPLSIFANYDCHNTSKGPTITIKCSRCQVPQDNFYVSWHFVDLPNKPATAVGFQFNLTAKNHGQNKHLTFASGTLKSRNNVDDRPKTFRGADANVLEFHLFPRVYHNVHNLRLIQPMFHDFLPGSSFFDVSQLHASLESSKDGVVNTTLHVNFLSDYIVEIDNENTMGPVSFLADVGGLYAVSFAIFFCCLVKSEHKIKRLRSEDSVLRKIRSRKRAQEHWDKLRKYVMYTWSSSKLDENSGSLKRGSCGSFMLGIGSLRRREQKGSDHINSDRKSSDSIEMNITPKVSETKMVQSHSASTTIFGTKLSSESQNVDEHEMIHIDKGMSSDSFQGGPSHPQEQVVNSNGHVLPSVPEITIDGATDMSVIQRNLQNLYNDNICLRERVVATQSLLEDLLQKVSIPSKHAQHSVEESNK